MDTGRKTTLDMHEETQTGFSLTKANADHEACVLLLPAVGRRTSPVRMFLEESAHLTVVRVLGREHHVRGIGTAPSVDALKYARDISIADTCVLLSDAGLRTC